MAKRQPNMRQKTDRQIRRRQAAAILGDLTPRTLRRYEVQGLLTPIKRNPRLTLYSEAEVLRLAAGKVAEPQAAPIYNTSRTSKGEFVPATN